MFIQKAAFKSNCCIFNYIQKFLKFFDYVTKLSVYIYETEYKRNFPLPSRRYKKDMPLSINRSLMRQLNKSADIFYDIVSRLNQRVYSNCQIIYITITNPLGAQSDLRNFYQVQCRIPESSRFLTGIILLHSSAIGRTINLSASHIYWT